MKTAMRKSAARMLALLLSAVLLMGMVPVSAAGNSDNTSSSDDGFSRIVHLDMGRKYFTADWIKKLIDEMAKLGYNQLELDFGNSEAGQLRFKLADMTVEYTSTETTLVPAQTLEETPSTVPSAGPSVTPSAATEPTVTPSTATEPTVTPSAATEPTVTPSAATEPSATPSATTEPSVIPSAATEPSATPSATTEPSAAPSAATEPAEATDEVSEAIQQLADNTSVMDQTVGMASNDVMVLEAQNTKVEKTVNLDSAFVEGEYLTEDDMTGIIDYADKNGIEIVPLLNSPGHFGAVLAAAPDFRYNGSQSSLDITDPDARAFGQAVVLKYAEWFAEHNCTIFNIGADEFANDIYLKDPGMGFGHLVKTQNYHYFVSYINELTEKLQNMGYTVRAFNDGINYGGQSGVDPSIEVCYWTSGGWNSYDVASVQELEASGFSLINTHGDYYYILGKTSPMTEGKIQASDFDATQFQGGTVSNPSGAMFCIWCDYPNAVQDEGDVMTGALPYMTDFASALAAPVTDQDTGVSVTAAGISDMTVKDADIDALAAADYVAYDMHPTLLNGDSYEGSAQVSIPLTEELQTYSADQLTGFVIEDDGSIMPRKGNLSGGTYTFTMPHFSVGGVMALNNTAATEYEQAEFVESGGQYLVVYQRSSWSGTSYYAMDKDGNAVELNMENSKLQLGDNDPADLLWTFTGSGNSWTIVNSGGTQLGMSGKRGFMWWTMTAHFDGTSPATFHVPTNGQGSISTTVWDGNNSKPAYLSGSSSEFSGSTQESTLYLYKSAEPTYPVTVIGVDATTGDQIGTTTLHLPAGMQQISAPEFSDYVAIATSEYPSTTMVNVTTDGLATVTFAYQVNLNVEPLELEAWITNAYVNLAGAQTTSGVEVSSQYVSGENGGNLYSVKVSAELAFGESGIALEDIIPTGKTSNGYDTVYWKGKELTRTHGHAQYGTDYSLNDNGDAFQYVRYHNGKWEYSNDRSQWTAFTSNTHRVVFYLQVTEVTDEVTTQAKDWGELYTNYNATNYVILDFAVRYSTGARFPDTFPNTKDDGTVTTIAYHCDPDSTTVVQNGYRSIGLIRGVETSDYEIYMITLTPSSKELAYKPNQNHSYTYNYDKEYAVWAETQDSIPEEIDGSNAVIGGRPDVESLKIQNRHGMLVTYYIRSTTANLSVEYYTQGTDTPFYTANYDAKEPQNFNSNVGSNGQPFIEGNTLLVDDKGDSVATILNNNDRELSINSNLSTIVDMPAAYKYRSSELVSASVDSSDPTVLKLYYTFEGSEHQFVADYGLPLEIKLSDIGFNVTAADINRVSVSGSGLSWNGSTLIFQFTSIAQGSAVNCSVTVHTKDGASLTSTFDVIPASTVYYEAEDQNFVSYDGAWDNSGISEDGNQQTEKLGSSSNYGSDIHYNTNGAAASNGASKMTDIANVQNGNWPTASFTFTGTGADIISQTDITSTMLLVTVKNDSAELERAYLVNNYYSAVNKGVDTIYQVPVIKIQNLDYGTYTVTVTPFRSDFFDAKGQTSFNFYLDAIRVYEPLGNKGDTYYAQDGEANAQFINLSKCVNGTTDSGLWVDNKPTADVDTYLNIGPNNEIYLAKGQSVTVTLPTETTTAGRNAQIGARVMNGGISGEITVDSNNITIKGGTDQYYTINSGVGKSVTIKNTGDSIVALTTLKLTNGN